MENPSNQLLENLTLALTDAIRTASAGSSEGGKISVAIPKFSGFSTEVARLWLIQTEEILEAKSVSEAKKVANVVGSLGGGALAWYLGSKELMRQESQQQFACPYIKWDIFRAHLEKNFPIAQEQINLRRILRGLKQTKGVAHYVAEFRTIYGLAKDMSNFDAMMNFIEGLRHTTQKHVLYKDPTSLEEAIQEAMKYDSAYFAAPSAKMYLQQLGGDQAPSGPPPGIAPVGPEPMDLTNVGAPVQNSRRPWQPRGTPRTDQLSVDEQRRRAQRTLDRLNGACFDCHRTGCRRGSSQCPKKQTLQHHNVETTTVNPPADSGN